MAYVSVDIDLDDIDNYELFKEAINRIKSYGKLKASGNSKKMDEFIEEIKEFVKELNISSLPNKTLEDNMKFEHLEKIWNNYSSSQFESLMP